MHAAGLDMHYISCVCVRCIWVCVCRYVVYVCMRARLGVHSGTYDAGALLPEISLDERRRRCGTCV
jgi:hypothetical protein